MAETDCLNFISQAMSPMGNKSIKEKLDLLMQVWNAYFSEGADTATADGMIRVKKGFNLLYRETSNLVFLPDYKELSTEAKETLDKILVKCGVHLDGLGIGKAKLKCDSLAKTCKDPWGYEYFKSLSPEDAQNATESFYTSEFPEIARARIERLIANGDESNAFRLCNNYITSKEHVFRESRGATSVDSSLDDELIPIFVFFIHLLKKQNNLKAIVDRTVCLSCHQGCRLIRTFMSQKSESSLKLALTLSEIFLLRDLIHPNVYCCTKELMEIWSELQVSLKVEKKLVQNNAWKMIVMYASTSAHFYLFVDVLWHKFGRELTDLYIEFYIRGLTSDLNHLEVTRVSAPSSISKELENHIAAMYTKLSQLFANELDIARECLLSAFSLTPTIERLNDLNKMCVEFNNLNGVKPPPIPQSENGDVIRPIEDPRGISIVPAHLETMGLVSGPVLYEEASFKPTAVKLETRETDTVNPNKLNFDSALEKELAKNGVVNPNVSTDSIHTSDSSRTELNGETSQKCNCEGRCVTPDLSKRNRCQTYPFVHPILNSKGRNLPTGVLMDLTTIIETTRCVKWRNFVNWLSFPEMAEDYLTQSKRNEMIRKPVDNDNDGDGSATEYEDQALPQQASVKTLPYVPKKPIFPLHNISDSETDMDEESDSFESSTSSEDFANSDETWESQRKKKIHKAKKKIANNPNERHRMIDHILRSSRKKKHRKVKGDKDRYFDKRFKKSHKKSYVKDLNRTDKTEVDRVVDTKPLPRPRQKSIDINNPLEMESIVGTNPRIMLSRLAIEEGLKTPVKAKPNPPLPTKILTVPGTSGTFKDDVRSKLQVSLLAKQAYSKTGTETAPLIVMNITPAATSSTIINEVATGESLLKKKVEKIGGKDLKSKKLPKMMKEEHLVKKKKKKKILCSMQTQTDLSLLFSPMVPPHVSDYLTPKPPEIKFSPNTETNLTVKKYFSPEGLPRLTFGGVATFSTVYSQCSSNSSKEPVCIDSSKVKVMSDLYKPPPKVDKIVKTPTDGIQNKTCKNLPNIIKSVQKGGIQVNTSQANQNNNNPNLVTTGASLLVPPNSNPIVTNSNIAVSNSNVIPNFFVSNSLPSSQVNSILTTSNQTTSQLLAFQTVNGKFVAVPLSTAARDQPIRLPVKKVVRKMNTSFNIRPQQCVARQVVPNSVIIPQALPIGRMPVIVLPQKQEATIKQPQNIVRLQTTVINAANTRLQTPVVKKKLWTSIRKTPGNHEYRKVVNQNIDHGLVDCIKEMNAQQVNKPMDMRNQMITSVMSVPETKNIFPATQQWNIQSNEPSGPSSSYHSTENTPRIKTEDILNQAMDMAEVPKTIIDSKALEDMSFDIDYLQQLDDADCAQADPESRAETATLYAATSNPSETLLCQPELNVLVDAASPTSGISGSFSPSSGDKVKKRRKKAEGDETPRKRKLEGSPTSPGFPCEICTKSMVSSYNLRRHMKAIHHIDIYPPMREKELEKLQQTQLENSNVDINHQISQNQTVSNKEFASPHDPPFGEGLSARLVSPNQMEAISNYSLLKSPNELLGIAALEANLKPVGIKTENLWQDNPNLSKPQSKPKKSSVKKKKIAPISEETDSKSLTSNPMEAISTYPPFAGQKELLGIAPLGANLKPVVIKTENPIPHNQNLSKCPTKPKKSSVKKKKIAPLTEESTMLDNLDRTTMIHEIIQARLPKKKVRRIQTPGEKRPKAKGDTTPGVKKPKKPRPPKTPKSEKPFNPAEFRAMLSNDEILKNLHTRFIVNDSLEDCHSRDISEIVKITVNEIITNVVDRSCKNFTHSSPNIRDANLSKSLNFKSPTVTVPLVQTSELEKAIKPATTSHEKSCKSVIRALKEAHSKSVTMVREESSAKPVESLPVGNLVESQCGLIDSKDDWVTNINQDFVSIVNDHNLSNMDMVNSTSADTFNIDNYFKDELLEVEMEMDLDKAIRDSDFPEKDLDQFGSIFDPVKIEVDRDFGESGSVNFDPNQIIDSVIDEDMIHLQIENHSSFSNTVEEPVTIVETSEPLKRELASIESIEPNVSVPEQLEATGKVSEETYAKSFGSTEVSLNVSEPIRCFENVSEEILDLRNMTKKDVTEPEADLASVSEDEADLASVTEHRADLASVTEHEADLASVTDPVEDFTNITEPVEYISNINKPIEDIENGTKPMEDVEIGTEPMKEIGTVTKPIGVVANVTEPVGVVANVTEPVGVVANVNEPVEVIANVAEPVGVVANVAEPVGVVANIAEPVGVVANVAEPVGVVANVAEPVGVVANVAEPVGVVANVAEPFGVVANVAEPFGVVANVIEPVGVVANVIEPVGVVANVIEPVGVVANVIEPVGVVANVIEPVGVVANVIEPVGVVAEPVVIVANVTEPVGIVANVTEPVGIVANVTEPVGIVANVTEPVGIVANVTEPVGIVANVTEPVGIVANVTEPVGIVANVTEPVGIVANVTEPVGIVANVTEPVGIVANVTEPVGIVANVTEPVGIVANVTEPVGIVANVTEPVGIVANVNGSVGVVTNVIKPVDDVPGVIEPISQSTVHPLKDCEPISNVSETMDISGKALEQIEAVSKPTKSTIAFTEVLEAITAQPALPCSTTVPEALQTPLEKVYPETTESSALVPKPTDQAIEETKHNPFTGSHPMTKVTLNQENFPVTAKHVPNATTTEDFQLSSKNCEQTNEKLNVTIVSIDDKDIPAKIMETNSTMQMTKEILVSPTVTITPPKKMTPREKQARLKKHRDHVLDTCKVVLNRIINIVVDQESKSNLVLVPASTKINLDLIETKVQSSLRDTSIKSHILPKDSTMDVESKKPKPILKHSQELVAQGYSTIKTNSSSPNNVPVPKLEKPMTFQEQYEKQIKCQMLRQAELEKMEQINKKIEEACEMEIKNQKMRPVGREKTEELSKMRTKNLRKPSNPTRYSPSKKRTLFSDPDDSSKEINFVVQGMVDRVSTSSQRKTTAILEKSKLKSKVSPKVFKISETLRDLQIPLRDCTLKTPEKTSDKSICLNQDSSPEIEVIAIRTKTKVSENMKCVTVKSTSPRVLSLGDSSKQTICANSCENKLSKQSSKKNSNIELRSLPIERSSKRNSNKSSEDPLILTRSKYVKNQIKGEEETPIVILDDTSKKTIPQIWEKTENSESSSEVDLLMEVDCCDNETQISDECKTPEECLSECEYLGTTKNDSSEPDSRRENEGFHRHSESNFSPVGRRRKRVAKSHKVKCACCEPEPSKKTRGKTSGGNSPLPQVIKRGRSSKKATKKTLPKQKFNKNSKNNSKSKMNDEGFRILRSSTRSMT